MHSRKAKKTHHKSISYTVGHAIKKTPEYGTSSRDAIVVKTCIIKRQSAIPANDEGEVNIVHQGERLSGID